MLPKVVFFDLDDTLIDHRNAARSALSYLQKEYAPLGSIDIAGLESLWQKDFDKYWEMLIHNRITIRENWSTRFRNLFSSLGAEIHDEDLDLIVSEYGNRYISGTAPVAGAIELLKKIRDKGIHVSIITNNIVEMQERKIKNCGLGPYIDSMTISQEFGVMKPDPEIFRIAMERSGCSPNESVMVGDSLESDILGAMGVGIAPVWLNRNGRKNELIEDDFAVLESLEPADRAWETIRSAFGS